MAEANQLERHLFGITHCDAGALMARRWGFPENLETCMADHHNPTAGQFRDPQTLIRAACRMAEALGFAEVPLRDPSPPPDLHEGVQHASEIEPEALWDEITRRIAAFE